MTESSNFGVCRLAIISLRKEPRHQSELISQILFGEHYSVTQISEDRKWFNIRCALDRYEGWIQAEQHHQISVEYFDQIENTDYKISIDLSGNLLFNKNMLIVTMGSILPISSYELFDTDQHMAFTGESKNFSQRGDGSFIEQIAKKYLNSPYLWGGKSPFGIDCSGFTQMVYRISGYQIPRDSTQQLHSGRLVQFDELETGDLVILTNTDGRVDHVGIALPNSKIIHASGTVRIDTLTDDGIHHEETNVITHLYHSSRRILP